MEKEEMPMTEKESILLITSMISKAQNRVRESGKLYLLWGWLIFFCSIIQFISLHFFNYNAYYCWFATWVLLIYQILFLRKKKRTRRVKTYTEDINSFIWVAFFVCLMINLFVAIQFKRYELITPLLLTLYGMPTFLSGIILKFKPLIFGGIGCWLIALLSPFINVDYQLLLVAVSISVGWIIPGYLLKQKFKKEN